MREESGDLEGVETEKEGENRREEERTAISSKKTRQFSGIRKQSFKTKFKSQRLERE